jgi:hypothetical protein
LRDTKERLEDSMKRCDENEEAVKEMTSKVEKESLERAELEQKKKEEREKNDKESRNFYAIRLNKIQTAHADEMDKMTADIATLENRVKELTAQKNSDVAELDEFTVNALNRDKEILEREVERLLGESCVCMCV